MSSRDASLVDCNMEGINFWWQNAGLLIGSMHSLEKGPKPGVGFKATSWQLCWLFIEQSTKKGGFFRPDAQKTLLPKTGAQMSLQSIGDCRLGGLEIWFYACCKQGWGLACRSTLHLLLTTGWFLFSVKLKGAACLERHSLPQKYRALNVLLGRGASIFFLNLILSFILLHKFQLSISS